MYRGTHEKAVNTVWDASNPQLCAAADSSPEQEVRLYLGNKLIILSSIIFISNNTSEMNFMMRYRSY